MHILRCVAFTLVLLASLALLPSHRVAQAPTVRFSTYLGGSDMDISTAIAIDQSGFVYVAGQTLSDDFPTQNAAQGYQGGPLVGADVFVAKYTPGGDALVYATYLGGSMGEEMVAAMAVDDQGRVFVAGTTTSLNFPTRNTL
ncbi:MAG TPA: SBBP repeat-containing protein, partial [Rhodothermales bacterium]|nr:SBBP repeat-containing protein [Rhodothermales bacterium]